MTEAEDVIEKKYFTIGEVADRFSVKPSLIRFWETEFPTLTPRKNRKGNRIYSQEDIEKFKAIYYLVKVRRFTLKGAQEKLKSNPKDLEYEQRTREVLIKVRDFLADLKNSL